MGTKYQKRAADLIQVHLTDLLRTRVNDPRVHMVTITGVDVTADTRKAHVYFSVLGGPEAQAEALAGLRSAAGFLRRELGQRIRLRNTPELVFHWDSSLERGERISSILDELSDEIEGPGSEP
ncbi:MAG TPA: 30S ribosome-binding factor RbfA [Anaerolineales bacterium]|nr:30S ribosome-binding factor RbfA [Anaerolineae bacterium]HIQ01614.1 30S ribosome-binding factor RbfA [Anaerolineales bacterium]